MKSTFKWTKKFQSIVDDDRNHKITLDLPPIKGGDDIGTTALELCAMSLNGCIGTIFAMMAAKTRIEFSQLEVEVNANRGEDDPTFTDVDYVLKIKTEAKREKVEKCLALTIESCPVGVLFRQAGVKINGNLEIL